MERIEEFDNEVKAKARLSMLLRHFVLPPVSERRMVSGGVKSLLGSPRWKKETDDTYIYYLLAVRGLCLSAFMSFLYWISFVWDLRFNLGLFTIRIDPENALRSMLSHYVVPVATIQIIFGLCYGLLLFRANIDFESIDLLHWNERIVEKAGGTREGVIRFCLIVAVLGIVAEYSTSGPILYILDTRPYLNNSPATVVILLISCGWIVGVCPCATLMGGSIAYQQWRRLGPRFKTLI